LKDEQATIKNVLTRVCDGRVSRQLDKQTVHSFPARMPLWVAEFLIKELTTEDSVVLDPMVGSGTTLVAARKLGRTALGFDMDPLAVLLARSAVQKVPSSKTLLAAAEATLEKARALSGRRQGLLLDFDQEEQEFLKFWFPRKSQIQLAALAAIIAKESRIPVRNFLWIVFSGLILVKSAGPSYALDLARSRPHRDLDKDVTLPFDGWMAKSKRAVSRLPSATSSLGGSVRVIAGDARSLRLPSSSVDFVLTSPPYLHAIDYIRAHKFALVWMEEELNDLRELRAAMIGSERGLFQQNGLPASVEKKMSTAARSAEARTRRYLSDIHNVLKEIRRVLKPGGKAVVVTGESILSKRRKDASHLLAVLGKSAGLRFLAAESRRITDRRRSLPPPAHVNESNGLSKRMRSESFVAFAKD
jgi:DNA modification methylase